MAPPAAPAPRWTAAGSRAAQAAARVAARYAQAPSFSQVLAAQAGAVPRAAAIAAPEAPPIAQPPFAELPVAAAAPRLREPEAPRAAEPLHPVAPASLEDWENECSQSRWEPDLRLRPLEPLLAPVPVPLPSTVAVSAALLAAQSAPRLAEELDSPAFAPSAVASPIEDRWDWGTPFEQSSESEEIEPVEPDLPIHANLIEFPRELVATRKMRPRLAEGPFAVQRPQMQLSIFEVDPGAISIDPEPAVAPSAAGWPEHDWSDIGLEPQLHEEVEHQEPPAALPALHLAPIGRRLTAVLADGALIAAVLVPVLAAAARIGHPPATKIVVLGAVSALLLAGMLYHALFLILAGATPGMRCARISPCTFDGQIPTREQLQSRLGALLLSLVPVGLGVAWALFDDDRLCWHDRLSRTYLRKY